MFKPKIGRPPEIRNIEGIPIGDYLFKYKLRK
jgi:hypothetical protein